VYFGAAKTSAIRNLHYIKTPLDIHILALPSFRYCRLHRFGYDSPSPELHEELWRGWGWR
jgi:hypothetical protein